MFSDLTRSLSQLKMIWHVQVTLFTILVWERESIDGARTPGKQVREPLLGASGQWTS